MIFDESFFITCAFSFCLFAKFLCAIVNSFGCSMYNKRQHLSSIPEKNESEEDEKALKWVPKKKHEVLKAKYKCLKKLFQIYDASVIGILPESYDQGGDYSIPDEGSRREKHHSRRKKRSYRTKTDACAGTTELSSGDDSVRSEEKGEGDNGPLGRPPALVIIHCVAGSIASAVIRDLKIQCSCSTQMMTENSEDKSQERLDRPSSMVTDNFTEIRNPTLDYQPSRIIHPELGHPYPYMIYNERKPTRFQSFIQRLFGIRREKLKANYGPNGHIYAASDNNITYNYCEKRRRRGLRFRRLKKAKKIHSEMNLRDVSSPAILNYVQTIQRNCLMDRTPRQCPIVGCKMMFYGIINYNDHLNLCHFVERKFICHYCHEGFELEYDKYVHENEHLGVNKLKPNLQNTSATSTLKHSQKSSNTQTEPDISKSDVPEDKLKKIVSFFDKIVDTEQMLTELNKNRYSESNLQTTQQSKTESDSATESITITNSDKRTLSCGNLLHRKMENKSKISNQSDLTSKYPYSPIKCHLCGEDFDYRHQLSHHVDLEHGRHDKPSKFHSCAGLADFRRRRSGMVKFEAGKINIQSLHDVGRRSSTTLTQDNCSVKSDATLSCDPSTNIIYYESLPTVKKPSAVNNFVDKVRSGITSYRWEPGTKIIRV